MSATTTVRGHVSRALDFASHTDLYFAIGKPTAWTDENSPDVPEVTATEVPEPIGFKKVEHTYMVVPDAAGEIYYRNQRWRAVTVGNALSESARWVYVDTTLSYDELPVDVTYRVVGVYSGLIRAGGVSAGKDNLLPNEVASTGILEVIDHRKSVTRQIDQRELLTVILEF